MQSSMSKTLTQARKHYVPVRLSYGATSYDCDDYTARLLRGLSLDSIMYLADEIKGLPKGSHAEKYAHLNNGAKRMNAGNVIRNSRK